MFQVGDHIVYGTNGVCRIAAIGKPDGLTVQEGRQYYTLIPLFSSETIYTPVDTKVFMRPVISQKEALSLIAQIPFLEGTPPGTHDTKQAAGRYQASLDAHECTELCKLIKTVYAKNQNAIERRRSPGQVDQYFMKRAEDLLFGELSVALDMPRENVLPYIQQSVSSFENVHA